MYSFVPVHTHGDARCLTSAHAADFTRGRRYLSAFVTHNFYSEDVLNSTRINGMYARRIWRGQERDIAELRYTISRTIYDFDQMSFACSWNFVGRTTSQISLKAQAVL